MVVHHRRGDGDGGSTISLPNSGNRSSASQNCLHHLSVRVTCAYTTCFLRYVFVDLLCCAVSVRRAIHPMLRRTPFAALLKPACYRSIRLSSSDHVACSCAQSQTLNPLIRSQSRIITLSQPLRQSRTTRSTKPRRRTAAIGLATNLGTARRIAIYSHCSSPQ